MNSSTVNVNGIMPVAEGNILNCTSKTLPAALAPLAPAALSIILDS